MELPSDFLRKMDALLGKEELVDFIAVMQGAAPVSIRYNLMKPIDSSYQMQTLIPWEPAGMYLDRRPIFTLDPLFHGGAYYVQEASSMLIGLAIKQHLPNRPSLKVLDLCAAPGGKSTHLLDLLPDDALLVSNEIVPGRFRILEENLVKWGRHNMVRSVATPDSLSKLTDFFDVIMIDAPCSGEGMMRKDEQAITHWSEQNIRQCTARQQNILNSAVKMLAPGGLLIYSTCTFNKQENEEIGDWLVDGHSLEPRTINNTESFGVRCRTGHHTKAYTAYPHLVNGEGFCMQAFRKQEGPAKVNRTKAKVLPNHHESYAYLADYCENNVHLKIIDHQDGLYFLDDNHVELAHTVLQAIRGAKLGRKLGEMKGKHLIPDHELAMSIVMREDIPVIFLPENEALHYLKGEAPLWQEGLIKGWNIIQYKGINLGWVKCLDNRVNNYYPSSYRIRMNLPTD